MSKGEQTRLTLLKNAMRYSSIHGISKVTIGEISKMCNISRTGVISHFKNKEDMQLTILEYSRQHFIETVVKPADSKDSLKRLRVFFCNWGQWIEQLDLDVKAGCIFLKASMEYQDQKPSPVRELIKEQQLGLLQYIEKLASKCIDEGVFQKNLDAQNFAQEAYSYFCGHNFMKNFFEKADADKMHAKRIDDLIDRAMIAK